MKKATAIFFLAVFLFSTTGASQLLKLPVVFQHYTEHHEDNQRISFFQFLVNHYLHGSPKDKDYERDMQLPFKSSNNCIASISPAFVPLMTEVSLDKPIEVPEKKKNFPTNQFALSSFLSSIWQPPKSC